MFFISEGTRDTKCWICSKSIKKGEKRLTANLGSGKFYRNYHIKCFIEKYTETLASIIDQADPQMFG